MKKIFVCMSIILVLVLSACTAKDTNVGSDVSQTPTKAPTEVPAPKAAYEAFGGNAPDSGIVLLVNNPDKNKAGIVNITESKKLDTTDEHILIIPKYKNTSIQIWSLRYENDKLVRDNLEYENRRTADNFVLDANIMRPEGMPRYKMVVYTPDSYAEYIFSYNGKDGNPELEYISAAAPKRSDKFSFHEMGYMFTNKKNDIVSIYGEPSEKRTVPFMGDEKATELIYGSSVFDFEGTEEKDGILYSSIVSDNKTAHPRGVKIGDDMKSILDKFPNSGSTKKIKFEDNADRTYSVLYGKYFHMQDFGIIEYVGDTPVGITYSTESSSVVFELENGKVSKVRYQIPLT